MTVANYFNHVIKLNTLIVETFWSCAAVLYKSLASGWMRVPGYDGTSLSSFVAEQEPGFWLHLCPWSQWRFPCAAVLHNTIQAAWMHAGKKQEHAPSSQFAGSRWWRERRLLLHDPWSKAISVSPRPRSLDWHHCVCDSFELPFTTGMNFKCLSVIMSPDAFFFWDQFRAINSPLPIYSFVLISLTVQCSRP
jgi:hypothetical protein